jgi:hypothetical protein
MQYENYFDNLKKLDVEAHVQSGDIDKIKEFVLEAVDYVIQHKLYASPVLESWQIMSAISKDLKAWGHDDSHKYWDGTMLVAVKELKDEIGKGTKEYQFTRRLCEFLIDELG